MDIASRLFAEKGYEAVSVRDILAEVNGAPGMFYYYFKSKQDIYIAAMEQYIAERLEHKCKALENNELPFEEKLSVIRSMIFEDVKGYIKQFNPKAEDSISDSAYKLWDLVQMLGKMYVPYSKFIMQGINEGKIKNNMGITEENAELFALFITYGAWGVMYNSSFTEDNRQFEFTDVIKIIEKMFY